MNALTSNSIAAMLPDLTAMRHHLHRHPELMYDVPRTAGLVANGLRGYGFDEVIEGIGRTGVLGILHGKNGPATSADKRVLLRADMDALPIQEISNHAYKSTVHGKMHACGHDGHTVMLMGAARHLAETRNFDGTIVFCFQPAEEGGAGAEAMIEDGMLDRFPVKAAYGMHNWPGIPVGQFAFARGPAMASGNALFLRIKGRGGHAAAPHLTRDPVVIAAHIVTALQTIVSRVVDPLQPAVVSVTSIHGGDAFNIIPEEVEMKVNFRTFSDEVSTLIDAEIRRICQLTAASFSAAIEIVDGMEVPYPATINHEHETDIAIKVARELVGADKVDDAIKPMMASEDFAFVLRRVPGCYLFIGNGDSAGLHNPAYDFNDGVIPHGVAFWSALVNEVLPA